MADWKNDQRSQMGFDNSGRLNGDVTGATYTDQGLRSHMLSIYNYMASGVFLTGIIAMLFSRGGDASPAAQLFYGGGVLSWVVMLSPLAFVLLMSFGRNKFSTVTLQAMFWGFAAAMGLSLSSIFLQYTGASIAATFFATAGAFAGPSLFGYTTKKDMSGMGSFLIMGVVGLIIASVINMYMQSGTMELVISFIGVLIFAALTAYDTQRLKNEYLAMQQAKLTNPAVAQAYPAGKMVIMGALSLYLDFINMFLFLLRFMGVARD